MKTLKQIHALTVTSHDLDCYHHMPAAAARADLTGLTLRQALRKLRAMDFGDLGGCSVIELSDGTYLDVRNVSAAGGGQLMGLHEARRMDRGETIAIYKL